MDIKNPGRPLDNKLLAALPRHHFDLLAPNLTAISLQQGETLAEPGDEFDHVYFPQNGMLSLLAVLQDGKAIETATVGREGVVGAMAGLGLYKSLVRAVVQLPMTVSRIPASQFRRAAAQSEAIRNMCIQYNEVLLSQARVTAACNALHVVEARFCRWLLQSADRAESDTVALTHEFLAEMLGVPPHLGDGSREQDAGRRRHQLHARPNYDPEAIRFGENVLRVLSDARGPVGYSDLGESSCGSELARQLSVWCQSATLPASFKMETGQPTNAALFLVLYDTINFVFNDFDCRLAAYPRHTEFVLAVAEFHFPSPTAIGQSNNGVFDSLMFH